VAAVNMGVQILLHDSVFNSFEYIPRSGIVESYGNSNFKFWKTHHNIFTVFTPFYIPPSVLKDSYFSIFSLTFPSFLPSSSFLILLLFLVPFLLRQSFAV
jgi:hypothetical protein